VAHCPSAVSGERRVAGPVEGEHLVQVQVRVDERLGDQRAGRVDHLGAVERSLAHGSDPVAGEADPARPFGAAQRGIGDDEVEPVSGRHAAILPHDARCPPTRDQTSRWLGSNPTTRRRKPRLTS
jgi:hypothetical protein